MRDSKQMEYYRASYRGSSSAISMGWAPFDTRGEISKMSQAAVRIGKGSPLRGLEAVGACAP